MRNDDVEKLIRDDNKTEFTSFLRSEPRSHGCEFSPSQLLELICVHRAVECAASFLEEKSGYSVDLNVPLADGMLPLQHAAESLSFRLTSLFLEHGADANVPGDPALLPLSFALKGVSEKWLCDWSPEKSIFKLLYIFCLRDLKEPLDTIRLLAEGTTDIEKVASYCVEEVPEIARLAALLMAAWKRLMPSNVENAENSLVGQLIWRHISDVVDEELRVMITSRPNCELLEPLMHVKMNLVTKWKFLKVLEVARVAVDKYLESEEFKMLDNFKVPYEVRYWLDYAASMEVKSDDLFSDDVECLRPKLPTGMKAQLNEAIEKQLELWSMVPESKTRAGADKSQASLQKELSAGTMVSSLATVPVGGGCSSLWSSPSSSRGYHTRSISFGKPVEVEVPRNPNKLARPPLLAKICVRLLLVARRSIK